MATTMTVFKVEDRTPGKHWSRTSRKNRMIPAVIYGPKMENKNVLIDEVFVQKHRSARYESAIFETQSDNNEIGSLKVMLKNIQYHPASNRPIHVDLYALDMAATIRVNVQIKYVGEPIGVKEDGGIRQVVLHEVEIECNPLDIPEFIQVDISDLELNTSKHVSDISFPAGVKPMTALDRTLVTVNLPKEEKVEEVVPVEGAEATAAPAAGEKKD